MSTGNPIIQDACRVLREGAGLAAVANRGQILVTGRDRASFLQGLLTNDIVALQPGAGCYAAWLTAQGRMLTDLHVFEAGEMMLLDVPAELAGETMQRLDQFVFGEDVQFADLSGSLTAVWIHGPAAAPVLERVIAGASGLSGWASHQHARLGFGESPAVVARVDQLAVPGYCIYIEPGRAAALRVALVAAGASEVEAAAADRLRIEAGYPVFGRDMDAETIPLEAGLESRAFSFTKGCYVGQEVIIRVLHRGHGRVARKLVVLRMAGDVVPAAGARVVAGGREAGSVTSAAPSIGEGAVALAYLHRDFIEPGTAVEVETDAGLLPALVIPPLTASAA